MSDETPGIAANSLFRESASAGVAPEMTAQEPLPAETVAAFGRWLGEKLNGNSDNPERVAMHTGLPVADIAQLINGQGDFPLKRDQVQRIASALVEMGLVSHADEVWAAASLGDSDYLVAPRNVVQAMSGTI